MNTSPTHDVCRMYDETAEGYARMMDEEIKLPIYADVLSRLAERIQGIEGPVVDCSCGSGHMLSVYRENHDPQRALVGIDLSPSMVEISKKRLGEAARVEQGDMRRLSQIDFGSAAAVINYFAIHHLGPEEIPRALAEWHRVLCSGGQLLLAAWEGQGEIDYQEAADLVALRYSQEEISSWAKAAGFVVDGCRVEYVQEMDMSAVYLEGTRKNKKA